MLLAAAVVESPVQCFEVFSFAELFCFADDFSFFLLLSDVRLFSALTSISVISLMSVLLPAKVSASVAFFFFFWELSFSLHCRFFKRFRVAGRRCHVCLILLSVVFFRNFSP